MFVENLFNRTEKWCMFVQIYLIEMKICDLKDADLK